MKITVLSSKTVRPAYGHGGLACRGVSNGATVPLTVLDKVNFDDYISIIYAFRPPMPPNSVLEAGLAKVLAGYPEWAGRLGVDADGNRAIRLNDEGARFVEATADDATLESVLPLKPTAAVRSLHPSGDGAEELMLIQVTRFTCGSVVVGFTTQHIIADGHATSNFFVAWSQATRGAAINPVPVHDRRSFFTPRHPPQVLFEHRGVEFKASHVRARGRADDDDEVVMHKVHFTQENISKLKTLASPPGVQRPCSTTRCLVAHLWRCMTVARGLRGSVTTTARIAVDGRARMTPPVPNGYTGNVVLWAHPTATAQELVMNPLHYAVELINRELARLDNGYFRSFVDFASSGAVEKERLVPTADVEETVLSPNIEVDSWIGIPFCDVDFGGGPPLFFMPGYLIDEGVLILVPSHLGDGSVDVYVTLFSSHMDVFKYCSYSLDK